MFVAKVRIVFTDKRMLILEAIFTLMLFAQAVLRLALSWHDREAKGLLVLWVIWIFVLGTQNFMAALRKPIILIFWFPMILSRSGRGLMYIFLTLPMITREVSTIILGILILLFGIFNILIGFAEAPIDLKM